MKMMKTIKKLTDDLKLLGWPAALALAGLVPSARFPEIRDALGLQNGAESLRLVLVGLGNFGLAWLVARLIGIGLARTATRGRPVPRLLEQLAGASLFFVALIVTMTQVLGHGAGGALASSGLLIALIGFAIRNVVADTLSGIALGLDAPFRIGDWVEIENIARGRVIDIRWRTTRLLTRDSTYMILPNSQIARQRMTNFSAPRREYRAQVEITLDHGLPVAEARMLLLEVMRNARLIIQEPAPDVRVLTYAADGIHYALRYWVPRFDRDVDCRDELFEGIDRALRERGIAPPRQRIEIGGIGTLVPAPAPTIDESPPLPGRRQLHDRGGESDRSTGAQPGRRHLPFPRRSEEAADDGSRAPRASAGHGPR